RSTPPLCRRPRDRRGSPAPQIGRPQAARFPPDTRVPSVSRTHPCPDVDDDLRDVPPPASDGSRQAQSIEQFPSPPALRGPPQREPPLASPPTPALDGNRDQPPGLDLSKPDVVDEVFDLGRTSLRHAPQSMVTNPQPIDCPTSLTACGLVRQDRLHQHLQDRNT